MIVKFQKEYLSELYYEGKCKDKKHRYQPANFFCLIID